MAFPRNQARWLADVIDVDIQEEFSLAMLFREVCLEADFFRKYMSKGIPSRGEEELLEFVCDRLRERLLRGEIVLEWDSGNKVPSAEALALLKGPETWNPVYPDDDTDYDCLRAVDIWSYDRKRPFKTWLKYKVRTLFQS